MQEPIEPSVADRLRTLEHKVNNSLISIRWAIEVLNEKQLPQEEHHLYEDMLSRNCLALYSILPQLQACLLEAAKPKHDEELFDTAANSLTQLQAQPSLLRLAELENSISQLKLLIKHSLPM